MGLAKGSEAFIFGVLRKNIYSDPIKSLLREYLTNGKDEHTKIGINTPLEITLPTFISAELKIRDFGAGLTDEEVFFFFGNYGASDKRQSENQVGMYGLGCKSAFAYTDAFTVTSYKDGKATTFNIYIDETEVGKVARVGSSPTDEANGVLITVPVKNSDLNTFHYKAKEIVKFFDVKPHFKGVTEQPVFEQKKALISGERWAYFGGGTSLAIMGEIAYPINSDRMGDISSWERQLLRSDLHIYCKIGEVEVTASREELQMSERTREVIRKRLTEIKTAMIVQTEAAFKGCKSLLEAKKLYYSGIMQGSGYAQIIRDSGTKIQWKGVALDDNVIHFENTSPHKVLHYSTTYQKKKIYVSDSQNLPCTEGMKIYFDDTDKKAVNYKRRAKTIFDTDNVRQVTVLQTSDVAGLEKILGVKVSEFESFNAIVPTVPPRMTMTVLGSGIDKAKRAKHQKRVFVLDKDKVFQGIEGAASNAWAIKDIELKGGLYIPIERFQPALPKIECLRSIELILSSLRKIGIEVRLPIYGLKKGEDSGKLMRFDYWLKLKLDRMKKQKELYALGLSYRNNNYSLYNAGNINADLLPEGKGKEYISLYAEAKEQYQKFNNAREYLFKDICGMDIEEDKRLQVLSKEFEKAFPLLKYVNAGYRECDEVIEYIKEREAILAP